MKVAIDTNIAVAALNGDARVLDRLDALEPADVVLPDPVIAELLYGARTSRRVDENVVKVNHLLEAFATAPFDTEAARRFGEIKAALRTRGVTKQDFDLAIACVALVHGATLITNDRGLLNDPVPDLLVENWLAPNLPNT